MRFSPARSTRDGDGYVVIELKRGMPGERLVNQLVRYMDDVADWVDRHGGSERVRGVVVAAEVDKPMHDRLTTLGTAKGYLIEWLQYRVDFELQPVAAGIGDTDNPDG